MTKAIKEYLCFGQQTQTALCRKTVGSCLRWITPCRTILGNEIPYDEVVVNNKINLSDTPIYAVLDGEKRTDMPKVYLTDGMIEIDSANRLKSLDTVTLCEKNVTDDDDVYIAYYSDNRLVYIQKTDAAERQSLDVYKSGEYDSVTVIVWQKDSLKPVGYPLKI